MTENEKETQSSSWKEKLSTPYMWAFTTYFTEGFPFIMIRTVASVFFRDMKVSLEYIGLTSLFGLPWILKFLWGPLVDEYSTKRRWLLTMQTTLLVIFIIAACVVPLSFSVPFIAILFFIGSTVAATHDIAIDGYYMEALDKDGQAKFVGYRTMAFRIAMMTGTGVIITLGAAYGWFLAFWTAVIIFGLFLAYHVFFLPEIQSVQKPTKTLLPKFLRLKPMLFILSMLAAITAVRYFFNSSYYVGLKNQLPFLKKIYFSHWVALLLFLALILVGIYRNRLKSIFLKDPDSYYSKAFVYFMDRDKISIILAFILLLRAGEWTLSTMVSPFMVDLGVMIHYGWISGVVGLPASILGALWGGWMISRYSLKKVMWPFLLAQNFTNVIYMALAIHLARFININPVISFLNGLLSLVPFVETSQPVIQPLSMEAGNLMLVALTHGFDQFASGLGTAVLMTYLMRICHQKFKAAHYAIGTALMSVSGVFAGVLSGFVAQWLGYSWLFGLSFVISIPAMILIPFLPNLEDGVKQELKS
ncbi:MAG: AmpG family muropeptide MFS transporter [bacterium]|nr:AmpG family muropeptide MFS transporter [bacterium]